MLFPEVYPIFHNSVNHWICNGLKWLLYSQPLVLFFLLQHCSAEQLSFLSQVKTPRNSVLKELSGFLSLNMKIKQFLIALISCKCILLTTKDMQNKTRNIWRGKHAFIIIMGWFCRRAEVFRYRWSTIRRCSLLGSVIWDVPCPPTLILPRTPTPGKGHQDSEPWKATLPPWPATG